MLSTLSFQSLTVLCMKGVLVMMMGAEAAPRAHPEKTESHTRTTLQTHKKPTESESTGPVTVILPLHLDPNYLVPFHSIRPIWNHSISPWTYNTTYDDRRFPPIISEVRCSLKGCLNIKGKEDWHLKSKPIFYQILVLRKVMGSGKKCHYRLEPKVISVGCTCVRPTIKQ
ncbi:interleukin-17F-like [Salvelinus namaycush]|uniref:Interleukin-17F-like n=1 Tax=Salvelinus namaycush TaxID=8040 RepID=A0A8U0TP90_SALNM|nr:interleukin-17F-like [Salvelinus namaycush]